MSSAPDNVRLFSANCAWLGCAMIAHNLLRAAATLAGGDHTAARGATLRRDLVNVPARFAAPARKPMLHLPTHWPRQSGGKPCGTTSSATRPRNPAPPDPTDHGPAHPAIPGRTRGTRNKEKLVQASRSRTRQTRPGPAVPHRNPRPLHEITHPRIEAKGPYAVFALLNESVILAKNGHLLPVAAAVSVLPIRQPGAHRDTQQFGRRHHYHSPARNDANRPSGRLGGHRSSDRSRSAISSRRRPSLRATRRPITHHSGASETSPPG